uniref:medium-chain acyl-CoA ligase n=1 Tax=Podarcis muralis TaxID=64176 RepID=A0A670K3Y4_PODMU
MQILLKLKTLRPVWSCQSLCRAFQNDNKRFTSLDLSQYEAINRGDKEVPEYFNFASDVLDQWSKAEKDGSRASNPALWWIDGKGKEVRWSFEELGVLSRKAANVLSGPCGLQRGDRVVLILPRVPEWWLLNVACIRSGIVFLPGTPQLTAKDIQYRLQVSQAKCIITHDTLTPAVDSISSSCPFLKTKLLLSEGRRGGWLNFKELLDVAPSDHSCVKTKSDEPMTIYFTSGTTGSPKMAEHSQSSLALGLALSGSYKFKSLRHCLTGGEPLNPEVMVQWKRQTGLDIYEGYGQTEVGIISQNEKGKKIKPGSMGTPAPPYDVQIIDENGNILPRGEEGDIAIRIKSKRPFCFFSRYVDNPEKNASVFRGNFYITGDRGLMDEDGYLWFVGRSDDVIISSGYRIGPFEVESALIEHPAVVESAVVSSPDPVRGEVVKAFVVLSPSFASHNPEKLTLELQEHVKKVTAPYKYPRKMEFVQELPKTITGKIRRNVLRKKEWGPI